MRKTLLQPNRAGRYVVYGVVTEVCVKAAAFGLLKTGKRVELVKEAIQHLSEEAARQMLDEFTAAGGHVVSLAEVCMSPLIG